MIAVACLLLVGVARLNLPAETRRFDFEEGRVRKEPRGFDLINGYDRWGASWEIRRLAGAPSGQHVLVESKVYPARSVIPKVIVRDWDLPDGELRVKLRVHPSAHEQPGGLVLRYRDERNYLLVSANADPRRLVVRRVERGRVQTLLGPPMRRTRASQNSELDPARWHQLRVRFDGPSLRVFLNDELVGEVVDSGPLTGTRAGLWSEPGSIVYFDDLELEARPVPIAR